MWPPVTVVILQEEAEAPESEGHTPKGPGILSTPLPLLGTRLGNLKHISCHPPKQAQHWVLFAPSLEKPETRCKLASGRRPWGQPSGLCAHPCDGLSFARKSPHHGSGFWAWIRLGACPVPPVTRGPPAHEHLSCCIHWKGS